MEISIKKNNILLKHKLKSNELFKFSKKSNLQSFVIYKKPQICKGYSSKCEDGKHILMLDYDNVAFNVVEEDIKILEKRFNINVFYVFYTKREVKNGEIFGSFHVISLTKHTPSTIINMLSNVHVDENFKTSPSRNIFRTWVLRLSKKNNRNRPRLMFVLGTREQREISSAHKTLISKFYNKVKHPEYVKEDGLKIIKLQTYETFK